MARSEKPYVPRSRSSRADSRSALKANAPPTDTRLTPSLPSSAIVGADGRASTFSGRSRDSTTLRISSARASPGEQHVGAGLLIGLQTRDRVGEVLAAVDEVLGARGEHQVHGPAMRDLGRSGDPL